MRPETVSIYLIDFVSNMVDTQKKIVAETANHLKISYKDDSAGHGWLHLERVWMMAKKLSKGEEADMFLVEMGALLHDADDYKFRKPGDEELVNTKKILSRFEIDSSTKEKIYDIVSHVSFKGGNADDSQKTLEGKIVQDADRLDVLGAVGIARVFAYGGWAGHPIYDPEIKPRKNITFEEYKADTPSVNHFYEKLLLLKDRLNTPQAKKIAERRHRFIKEYLEEFWKEVRGDR